MKELISTVLLAEKYDLELNCETVLHVYKMAKEYCANHGMKIYNGTRGGKLEVFERVDFDSLFG